VPENIMHEKLNKKELKPEHNMMFVGDPHGLYQHIWMPLHRQTVQRIFLRPFNLANKQREMEDGSIENSSVI